MLAACPLPPPPRKLQPAGLGGEDTPVPMALLIIAGAVLSRYGLLVLARTAYR